jgi:hypothetical protein
MSAFDDVRGVPPITSLSPFPPNSLSAAMAAAGDVANARMRSSPAPPWILGNVHAAVLGFQLYSVASETPCLRAQIGGLCPRHVLAHHPNNLLFRKPGSLHLSVLQKAGR